MVVALKQLSGKYLGKSKILYAAYNGLENRMTELIGIGCGSVGNIWSKFDYQKQFRFYIQRALHVPGCVEKRVSGLV